MWSADVGALEFAHRQAALRTAAHVDPAPFVATQEETGIPRGGFNGNGRGCRSRSGLDTTSFRQEQPCELSGLRVGFRLPSGEFDPARNGN